MGPRHIGRGNLGYRFSLLALPDASMGPRHIGRGNDSFPGRGGRRLFGFNGAASHRTRKCKAVILVLTGMVELQWGRVT